MALELLAAGRAELQPRLGEPDRLDRRDLSTQIIPFNLGRAVLQNDPSQDLELQPGDVVTIYSQKDLRVPVARQTSGILTRALGQDVTIPASRIASSTAR